jgi:tetratricopeptide (TPR) repeat protein
MQAFRESRLQDSLGAFDKAQALVPTLHPYLWQRGLTLYYLDRFAQAAQQFRDDLAVNPLDVEEIVWENASMRRLEAAPRATSLPPGKQDPRRIMVSLLK